MRTLRRFQPDVSAAPSTRIDTAVEFVNHAIFRFESFRQKREQRRDIIITDPSGIPAGFKVLGILNGEHEPVMIVFDNVWNTQLNKPVSLGTAPLVKIVRFASETHLVNFLCFNRFGSSASAPNRRFLSSS